MKIVLMIFGRYFPVSYVMNLQHALTVLHNNNHQTQVVFVQQDLDFLSLNKALMFEDKSSPWNGEIDYDAIFVSGYNTMPDATNFDKAFNNDYNVFTFTHNEVDGTIPYVKLDDKVPLNCFVMRKGVIENIGEYPWIQPSITSFTDGFMGSVKEDVVVIPDIRMYLFQ